MSANQETIDRFRKMATDDPTNELAHYRLGGLLMDAGQFPEAIESFRRTLELSPQFSKVYQLLGQCYLATGQQKLAADTWTTGYKVADERGDNMPREEMGKLLAGLGEAVAEPKPKEAESPGEEGSGTRSQRPQYITGG